MGVREESLIDSKQVFPFEVVVEGLVEVIPTSRERKEKFSLRFAIPHSTAIYCQATRPRAIPNGVLVCMRGGECVCAIEIDCVCVCVFVCVCLCVFVCVCV